jgi:hypothetical protein
METTKRKLREGLTRSREVHGSAHHSEYQWQGCGKDVWAKATEDTSHRIRESIQKINDKDAAKMFEQKQRKMHPIVQGRGSATWPPQESVCSLLPSSDDLGLGLVLWWLLLGY